MELKKGKSIEFNIMHYILGNIRIYHECEGRIEKSVPRITVWHHEACRVMTNDDHEEMIFLSYPHTHDRFIFLLTTIFYLKINIQESKYNFTR